MIDVILFILYVSVISAISFIGGMAYMDLIHYRRKTKEAKDFFQNIADETKAMEAKLARAYWDRATRNRENNTAKALNIK